MHVLEKEEQEEGEEKEEGEEQEEAFWVACFIQRWEENREKLFTQRLKAAQEFSSLLT